MAQALGDKQEQEGLWIAQGCWRSSSQSKAEGETKQICLEEMLGTARTLLVKTLCLLALRTS